MKILHIVPSYKPAFIYGGPIESVAALCESLSELNNQIYVYTTTANGVSELDVPYKQVLDVDSVFVTYYPRITKGNVNISPSLWSDLNKNCKNFDIVHIHSWWNPIAILAAIICQLKGVKTVISPRGMLSDYIMTKTYKKLKNIIHVLFGKKALGNSIFHATSYIEYKDCKNLIAGWEGFLLPNLINLPNAYFERLGNDIFTLVFLSRIHPKKGLEHLFKAIALLDFPIVLRIAGTGDENYISQLKTLAKSLAIDHLVYWLGWKDQESKYKELASSDLFVLTSFNENFANVVIESLYVGTPVLVSNDVGLAAFVNETDLGWSTDLDYRSIADSIKIAASDNAKRNYVNVNGRNIINDNFSKPVLANKYVAEYKKIIGDEKYPILLNTF